MYRACEALRLVKRTALVVLVSCLLFIAGSFQPAAPASRLVNARRHIFGVDNVDARGNVRRDRVVVSWFSISSLAMAIDGHVVLLDTYIHKGEDHPNYVPTTTSELADLRPEAIFLGHGHFDHANTAGELVVRTGARLVGTPEHCDQTRSQAEAYAGRPVRVRCIATVTRGSDPGRQVREIRPLGPRVGITVLKHVHSGGHAPDGDPHESTLTAGLPDPNLILLYPMGPTLLPGADPRGDEGSSLLYQFRFKRVSLVWNDTVGPLREEAPELVGVLKRLPRTDVHFGAVQSPNGATNGMRDPVDYIEALRPKIFYPIHHDFVAEYGMSKGHEGILRRELARRSPPHPEVRWLYDPYDYLRPALMTFDVADPRFAD